MSAADATSAPPAWAAACWRRALVFGLGLSGRAAAELLLRRGVFGAGRGPAAGRGA
jgi:hypothetical protein